MTKYARLFIACVAVVPSILLIDVAVAQMPGPTKEHEVLKSDVGTWDAKMKLFHTPGAEPTVQDATETVELMPGGMWLLTTYESKIMDMPFSGRGVTGYDPVKKKYVGTWVDNLNPHLHLIEGDYDPPPRR